MKSRLKDPITANIQLGEETLSITEILNMKTPWLPLCPEKIENFSFSKAHNATIPILLFPQEKQK